MGSQGGLCRGSVPRLERKAECQLQKEEGPEQKNRHVQCGTK